MTTSTTRNRPSQRRTIWAGSGLAPLTLVEHALCPLDRSESLKRGACHTAAYAFTDRHRNRKVGQATVACPFGLSAHDELYLYGMLALTFSQAEPMMDFYATPHWCLKQLGIVDAQQKQGSRYRIFRDAIRRLSAVVYQNNAFYDPIRGEHRDVAFGFLKYSLPVNDQSSRAWHLIWDQQFYRIAESLRGSFAFDFATYRALDPATRRIFLLLQKTFHRHDYTPGFEIRDFGIQTVGLTSALATKAIKQKLLRCARQLLQHNIIRLPDDTSDVRQLFEKREKGIHLIRFWRGEYFDQRTGHTAQIESPLREPLAAIGLDTKTIDRVLRRYKTRLVQEWSDITLAAKERGRIRQTPAAYFMHHVKEAAERRTTPPDWWRELCRREARDRHDSLRAAQEEGNGDRAYDDYLHGEGKEAFERVMRRVFDGLRESGQSESEARRNAEYFARMNLRRRFRQEHPEAEASGPTSVSQLLRERIAR